MTAETMATLTPEAQAVHPASGPTNTPSTAPTSNPVAKGCSACASLPGSLRYEHGLILAEATTSSSTAAFQVTDDLRDGWPPTCRDRERRPGRALGRTPGRGDRSRIEEGLPMFGDRFPA